MNITTVVTTAPRQDCQLQNCLESLFYAGFEPAVFAEPGSTKTEFPTISWEKKQGLWNNWQAACRWAIDQNTQYIMTVQDDCIFHPDTKQLISQILPLKNMGYLSLYAPSHYQEDHHGNSIQGLYTVSVHSVWGALALIFERDTLQRLLDDPRAKNWLGIKPKNGTPNWQELNKKDPSRIKNSDYIIGSILWYTMNKYLYYVSPSPCYHSATYSTVGHSGNNGKRNSKYIADHSKPLIPQIFKDELSISTIGDLRISQSNRTSAVYYHRENLQLMLRQ